MELLVMLALAGRTQGPGDLAKYRSILFCLASNIRSKCLDVGTRMPKYASLYSCFAYSTDN